MVKLKLLKWKTLNLNLCVQSDFECQYEFQIIEHNTIHQFSKTKTTIVEPRIDQDNFNLKVDC